MEIKHTIEILTKDIQDIEKLVRNLNNSPLPPKIELDLAMAKLRNVYELLAMIASDVQKEKRNDHVAESDLSGNESGKQANSESGSHVAEESIAAEAEKTTSAASSSPDKSTEEASISSSAPSEEGSGESEKYREEAQMHHPEEEAAEMIQAPEMKEPEPVVEEAQVTNTEDTAEKAQEQELKSDPGQAQQELLLDLSEETVSEIKSEETVSEVKPEETLSETKDQKETKKATILAEKFASNASINEKIAAPKDSDITTKLSGEPIDSIRRNIGINDRFMIIRELLGGETDEYNTLVQKLDTCANFNESFKVIEAKFPEKLEHDGVKLLVNLSRRKFISSGNV